ncbi:MAG TPA: DUF111 family protein [Thermoleophilia bacterium]|nr:DUF111 family protein [Thermoleophilia bacterium]HQG03806.1 DUF111 family protein [Thermoleophilia bacterium]HQG53945.1 DUF111 family protein [Thermoleophilia bacterium]HQJ97157.1 DUF111 family protein [Thermoleophilia bacterium]
MLLLTQIDDRSGEVLGHALEELTALGVHNVQLLTSHTKKGRPGMVLLVDLEPELERAVAVYLAAELGAWGYHVVAAEHRHFDVEARERAVTVVCGARRATFTMTVKFFSLEGKLLRVKVERADVEAVQAFIREGEDVCASETVRALLEHELRTRPEATAVEVRLS